MTSLITGARGFCGRHLATRLKTLGHTVIGVDVADGPAPTWCDAVARADVADLDAVRVLLRQFGPTTIFHLAGAAKGDAETLHHVNVLGTRTLLEAVRHEVPDARVLLAGSAAEYGNVSEADLPVVESYACQPASPYGITKHAATLDALRLSSQWGLKVVVARPFNIVGAGVPGDLVVGALVARIRRADGSKDDRTVPVGNLTARRDFIAVDDVVTAYIAMAGGDAWGQVFNVCSGEARAIREVADKLCAFAHKPVHLRVDAALMRPEEVPVMVGSGAKARDWLGFAPTCSFDEALLAAWRGWSQA